MIAVYAFACRHKESSEPTIYNARSRAEALREFWNDVRDFWTDVRWIDLRVRKVGGPVASDMFRHVARLRGMPDLQPGERFTSGYGDGVIVGVCSGANFEVIFDSGEFTGKRLPLHPSEFKRTASQQSAGQSNE